MDSTINIIKYNLKEQKNIFIIESTILLVFTILSFIVPNWVTVSVFMIPSISTMLAVNFIIGIIRYSRCISSEEGRILFLAPIKGWEYMLAKNLEFIVIQLSVIVLACLGTALSGTSVTLVGIVGISTGFGLTIAFILITAFIPIVSSYVHLTLLKVVMTIIALIVYSIWTIIIEVLAYLMPYIYMEIGNFTRINLISALINLISFSVIIWISIYHIDNKLDII